MSDSSENKTQNKKELNSYKNIIKGSSFFGGVQVFNILISLIRGKFVAIILGPEGMGISALFNSASNTIQRFAGLGLNQSIIRDTAETESPEHKSAVIDTSLRLTILTALLGCVICAAFCIPLSKLTFGSPDYWWQFIILGVAVGLMIAGSGKLAILQGLHEVKRISKSSIIGGLAGLCIGVPLYYIFGNKGIVPGIVAVALSLYIFYSYSLYKSGHISPKRIPWKNSLPIARKLLALGIVLMAGDLLATLVAYLINLFVRSFGNLDDVGLYQAANSVTNQYAGVVFAALAMDYFPRLSKVASDNAALKETVNRQSEIVAWLITPAMTLLILSTPLLIRVLLSESFHQITPLMRWMGLGMLLRAFSFPMAYITFAKGNKKVFFLLEGIAANLLTLVLSCLFFYWFGIIGLGYALVADNALCFILYFIVNFKLYNYTFSKPAASNFIFGTLLTLGCFIASFTPSAWIAYTSMAVISAGAITWSLINLKAKFRTSLSD